MFKNCIAAIQIEPLSLHVIFLTTLYFAVEPCGKSKVCLGISETQNYLKCLSIAVRLVNEHESLLPSMR